MRVWFDGTLPQIGTHGARAYRFAGAPRSRGGRPARPPGLPSKGVRRHARTASEQIGRWCVGVLRSDRESTHGQAVWCSIEQPNGVLASPDGAARRSEARSGAEDGPISRELDLEREQINNGKGTGYRWRRPRHLRAWQTLPERPKDTRGSCVDSKQGRPWASARMRKGPAGDIPQALLFLS